MGKHLYRQCLLLCTHTNKKERNIIFLHALTVLIMGHKENEFRSTKSTEGFNLQNIGLVLVLFLLFLFCKTKILSA